MENHPIPQDVTGFQFKLIGSMTVKQFAYVAVGVISAFILLKAPIHLPFFFFFKLIFIPLLAAAGAVYAFVPIEGRPADTMTANLFKALFQPNQFIYQKVGKKYAITTLSTQTAVVNTKQSATQPSEQKPKKVDQNSLKAKQLQSYLNTLHKANKTMLDEKEETFLHTFAPPSLTPTQQVQPISQPAASLAAAQVTQQTQNTAPTSINLQLQQDEIKEQELIKEETKLEQEITSAKQEETARATNPVTAQAAHQKVEMLESQLQTILSQKAQLEQELQQLSNQLAAEKQSTASPAEQTAPTTSAMPAPASVSPSLSHVNTIPQDQAKTFGFSSVSDTPNLIAGVVKDSRGNLLSNILVEVKDKDGNPVRAFKTNRLGQFASATPLTSGTYTIVLEDPKHEHTFDTPQITANGSVLLPIEIISYDEREDLRRALFT